ncbi:MAG: GNAT family N-acetyltransferase [Planctomycetota bacterium]|nr:GNAT family N-acetyltransferase [Planctomycetota bacterium]
MLDDSVLETADRWWAGDFDCPPDALRGAATHVQAHAGRTAGAKGIWILVVGPAPLVSLPEHLMDPIGDCAAGWTNALVRDPDALAAALAPLPLGPIIGPAFIGYGTAATLDLSAATQSRPLTPGDQGAVATLRTACGEEAWSHGGTDPQSVPAFGCFDDEGELLALSGYKTWGDAIAHIAIVSAPRAQGRGLGTAAVARAAQHALDAGLLPQYRTLEANAPSMGIARKLGFERYGFSVFVRLPLDAGRPELGGASQAEGIQHPPTGRPPPYVQR